jgi:hypothetical protein
VLLGHACSYAAVWASIALFEPTLGANWQLFALGFAVFGEAFIMPFVDAECRAKIRDGLRAKLISRWIPFVAGALGAAFWIIAAAATWTICASFNSLFAIGAGLVLTLIWIVIGVGGSVWVVAGIAQQRLTSTSKSTSPGETDCRFDGQSGNGKNIEWQENEER